MWKNDLRVLHWFVVGLNEINEFFTLGYYEGITYYSYVKVMMMEYY